MSSSPTELRSVLARGVQTGWLQTSDPGPNRPILVLLHGFPDSPTTWTEQVDAFASSHWVVVPFLRGVGPSEASEDLSRYGLQAVVLDHLEILRCIDPCGERVVVVVGHDIGALHAWELARALGPRLSRLVIVNGVSLDQMIRRASDPKQLRRSWYIGVFGFPSLARPVLKRLEPRVAQRTQRQHASSLTESLGLLPHYRAALQSSPRALSRRLPRLRAPVLALWSAHDAFLLPPNQRELERMAEQFTIRRLPGNHWVHSDMPDAFNSALTNFLEDP